jgi:hypothetical protein
MMTNGLAYLSGEAVTKTKKSFLSFQPGGEFAAEAGLANGVAVFEGDLLWKFDSVLESVRNSFSIRTFISIFS